MCSIFHPKCGKEVFSDERPSVKMKFVNIWIENYKLEGIAQVHAMGSQKKYEMQSGSGTENLKNLDTILNVTSGVLHFVGESLVPDTIDKNCLEGAKVPQQEIQKNLH